MQARRDHIGYHIDPALLPLVEEQKRANEALRKAGEALPEIGTVAPDKLRRFRLYNKDGTLKPPLVDNAFDSQISAGGRVLTIRTFPVPSPKSAIAHFHGGGWALGSIYEQDPYLWDIAQRTSSTVFSIEYPLAPENQLPAILDISSVALVKLITQHTDCQFCLAGESAGANVALNSLLRLRSRPDLFERVRAVSLCYGVYDLSMTPSQRLGGSTHLGISTEWLEWFYALALPGLSRDQRSDPEFSPLYQDLAGLPPAIISVGELDPLLDDSLFLFQRWLSAGNTGNLHVYPQAPHGFNGLPTKIAQKCNLTISNFLSAHVK